jgi:hypothetical protein
MTVDFEDPADEETPHKYHVKVLIFADVKRKQLLGTHEQLILFNMPRELLEQLGIGLL